jgi:hypothetical protein
MFVEVRLKLDGPSAFGDKHVPRSVLLDRVAVGRGIGTLYIKCELSLDTRSELPSI